ncbi:MAG: hypothetical protein DIJKHBIC_02308 [Thermoanaerobaculia bacterium]|nr:hypothetical protein [Thermoanaerobaculia bacterium]
MHDQEVTCDDHAELPVRLPVVTEATVTLGARLFRPVWCVHALLLPADASTRRSVKWYEG